MILYHGTNENFDVIDLSKSKKNKDFGQGFYLTADRHQAERVAQQRALIDGGETKVYCTDIPILFWHCGSIIIPEKTMSEKDIKYLTNSISSEPIPLIMEDCHCSRLEAMDKLYESKTYKNLINPETGLYYQSTLYVYEFLQEELCGG